MVLTRQGVRNIAVTKDNHSVFGSLYAIGYTNFSGSLSSPDFIGGKKWNG